MEPLSLLFYVIMAILGLAVLYFLLSFFYILLLNIIKLLVLFFPLLLAVPIAAYLYLMDMTAYGVLALLAAFVLALAIYPKKKKFQLKPSDPASYTWPGTLRGRLLNRIDKAIAKPAI